MSLLTTTEVAAQLGVSIRMVQKLIRAGRLPAERLGRDFFVRPQDLAAYRPRPPGRVPKVAKQDDSDTTIV